MNTHLQTNNTNSVTRSPSRAVGKQRLLVVEDDADISRLLRIHLQDLGFSVEVVNNGIDGLNRAGNGDYQLIVLDLMLPGMDGLEICRRLRAQSNHTPVLMLTAKSSEFDRVLGLELGADDYLTKPFSIMELQARVKAILRRIELATNENQAQEDEIIEADTLHIDIARHTVSVEGREIELTAREYDLLLHFARHPRRVYSRRQLLDLVWGYSHDGYEHTVNSHINRLRKKIEKNPEQPYFIETVWGVGYRFGVDR